MIFAALVGLLAGCAPENVIGANPPLDIESLLDKTTPSQREIIDDGVVTVSEYERALLAQRECVAEAGATPGEVYEGSAGALTFDFEITAATEDEMLRIQEEADACLPEYFADVGSVWAYQRLLSPAERDEMRPEALACLDKAGLTELPDDATPTDMAIAIQDDGEISTAERTCLVEFGSLFATYVDDADQGHSGE